MHVMARRKPIGAVVSQLRRERGLSQVKLASLLGWDKMRLSRFERSLIRAMADDVSAIARLLSVTVSSLYGEK